MSASPKRPKTVNRLQRPIGEWERESGMPVRRLNLRVAAMMLAGTLGRADDENGPVFLTRGGVAMELRTDEQARVTRDVQTVPQILASSSSPQARFLHAANHACSRLPAAPGMAVPGPRGRAELSRNDTEVEALANLQEALELYFEDAPTSDATQIDAPEVRALTLQGA